jgi:hypothetical protein
MVAEDLLPAVSGVGQDGAGARVPRGTRPEVRPSRLLPEEIRLCCSRLPPKTRQSQGHGSEQQYRRRVKNRERASGLAASGQPPLVRSFSAQSLASWGAGAAPLATRGLATRHCTLGFPVERCPPPQPETGSHTRINSSHFPSRPRNTLCTSHRTCHTGRSSAHAS